MFRMHVACDCHLALCNLVWADTNHLYFISDVFCTRLGSLDNGNITYSTSANTSGRYSYGTVATHTCDEGFFLEGSETRMCEGDGVNTLGTWSGSHPACSGIEGYLV